MIDSVIDRTTLPAAFLDLAKSQLRVTHTRDDLFIKEQLAQAIDDVERAANTTIFGRTITCDTTDLTTDTVLGSVGVGCTSWPWLSLPFNNVTDYEVADGDGADITADYTLRQTDPGGVGSATLQGPTPWGWSVATFTFEAGATALDDIAPSLRRIILRRAASLYEFREAALPLTAADLAGEALVWRPDV